MVFKVRIAEIVPSSSCRIVSKPLAASRVAFFQSLHFGYRGAQCNGLQHRTQERDPRVIMVTTSHCMMAVYAPTLLGEYKLRRADVVRKEPCRVSRPGA